MYVRKINFPLDGEHSIFLLGPRGTGKTLWIKSVLPQACYLDLLDFKLYSELLAHPDHLSQFIPADYDGWVVLDEVQRVPELLNEVHRLIEHQGCRFILTGSSARSLKRKGVNLLAGRALRFSMYPLIIQELGGDFCLSEALKYGLLPATKDKSNPEHYLATYIQSYLKEEVLQEGLTRNLGAFSRFLEVASFSQGQVVNYSEIAREIGINRQVVANYFEILIDLLLAYHIPVFTQRAKRRLISKSKFYYFDVGIFRTLRPKGILDTPEEIDGAGLETLFLQSLIAVNDYYQLGYKIYFWQTTQGAEVDFIVYGEKGLHAFEVKRTENPTPRAFKHLKLFKNDYPQATLYLINLGQYKRHHEGIQVLPMQAALQALPELLA